MRDNYKKMRGTIFAEEHHEFQSFIADNQQPKFIFCESQTIKNKYSKFLNFKATFLQKLKGLRLNGEALDLQEMMHEWIEDNFDEL